MVFDLRRDDAPCYACLFPEDGEVEEVQCSVMGVFAPLTGIVGAMQADGSDQAPRRRRRVAERAPADVRREDRRLAHGSREA